MRIRESFTTTPDNATLRAIIREPAAEVGVSLDETLVNQLLADASGEPGALPLMQETMRQLWENVSEPYLPFSAYENMGRDGHTGLQVAKDPGVWVVWLDLDLFESVKGMTVKRTAIRYPLRVVRYAVDAEANPWWSGPSQKGARQHAA